MSASTKTGDVVCFSKTLGKGEFFGAAGDRIEEETKEANEFYPSSTVAETEQSGIDSEEASTKAGGFGVVRLEGEETSTKAVRFGVVRLHTHKRVLGDNPAVSRGPPVSLDWQVQSSLVFHVDDYENEQKKCGKKNTKLSATERYEILRAEGHSRGSFTRANEEIRQIKKESSAAAPAKKEDRPKYAAPFFVRVFQNKKKGGAAEIPKRRKVQSNRTV